MRDSSYDDSDPDYTPNGKQGSGRKRLSVLGKRIKVEADTELDHLLEDTDGAVAGNGSLDSSLVSSFRNRSMVWQVFLKEQNGEYVKCVICGHRLKLLSGSTTTMLNHYISKHTEEYQEALTNRVQAVSTAICILQCSCTLSAVLYVVACHFCDVHLNIFIFLDCKMSD